MPERIVDQKSLRKNTLETLGLLVERYPNLSIAEIIDNAAVYSATPLHYLTDEKLARGLNQLFVSYTQFEAAGIKP
jgi:hypothetical protein